MSIAHNTPPIGYDHDGYAELEITTPDQPKKREMGHVTKALAGDPNGGSRGFERAQAYLQRIEAVK